MPLDYQRLVGRTCPALTRRLDQSPQSSPNDDQAIDATGSTHVRQAPTTKLVWYSHPDDSMTLAWQNGVASTEPLGSFLMLIDARNGKT